MVPAVLTLMSAGVRAKKTAATNCIHIIVAPRNAPAFAEIEATPLMAPNQQKDTLAV